MNQFRLKEPFTNIYNSSWIDFTILGRKKILFGYFPFILRTIFVNSINVFIESRDRLDPMDARELLDVIL
jgi:hypothetical protein